MDLKVRYATFAEGKCEVTKMGEASGSNTFHSLLAGMKFHVSNQTVSIASITSLSLFDTSGLSFSMKIECCIWLGMELLVFFHICHVMMPQSPIHFMVGKVQESKIPKLWKSQQASGLLDFVHICSPI